MLGMATASQAAELYDFNYVAISGPIESFSFSFTTATFVTAGTSPAFAPFTVTDGNHTWTMTKDLVNNSGSGCFTFGTPGSSEFLPCQSFGVARGSFDASWVMNFTSLPSATGTYVPFFFGGDFGIGGDNSTSAERINSLISDVQTPATGTFTLTITDVPEPSTFLLIAFGLFAVALRFYRRSKLTGL